MGESHNAKGGRRTWPAEVVNLELGLRLETDLAFLLQAKLDLVLLVHY